MPKKLAIKIYHGFGHMHDLLVFGHVFRKNAKVQTHYTHNPLVNMIRLLKYFFLKPVPGVPLTLDWNGQTIKDESESDGFFSIEWSSEGETAAGWHDVKVDCLVEGMSCIPGEGKIFVPHSTQFGFISDIDDTILVSHSATIGRRLKELLFKNPHTRSIFPDVEKHYSLLAKAHTTSEAPNPFFYVSSSEWNLYDYLRDLFTFQKLPNGIFLLNQFKRWNGIWKTGKTKHEGKLMRILRVFEVYPKQRFVLMGDNSQNDPAIYSRLVEKFGSRIFAVYIRNVSEKKEKATKELLDNLSQKGVHVLLFKESEEAIAHSRHIGLI
jgi:phosphatidate phosphatase APP1